MSEEIKEEIWLSDRIIPDLREVTITIHEYRSLVSENGAMKKELANAYAYQYKLEKELDDLKKRVDILWVCNGQ